MSRVLPIPNEFMAKIKDDLGYIAKTIKKRREELGITQEELADKLGCEITTVQAYEQRRRHPSLTTFLLICRILKIKFSITH